MKTDGLGLAEQRRREATRAVARYFALAFTAVVLMTGGVGYAVYNAAQERDSRMEIRMEFCQELEKLKSQNREDVAKAKKDWPQTLRLLHLTETPELRRVAEEGWAKKLARNKKKSCPYTGHS